MRASLAAIVLAAGAAAADDHVAVYNWSAYAAPGVLEAFERQTGLRLIYDTYGEPEIAETRLLARASGYDVAVVSVEYLGRLIAAGAIRPIGPVAAAATIDPAVMARLAPLDPEARYAIPYLWGMTGLAVDPAALAARAPDAPADSWALLFDPKWVSRFAECGVALLDGPEEALGAALLWLGRDPNSTDPADVRDGLAALAAIAPYVSVFGSEHLDLFEAGEVCLSLSWNTDVAEAGGGRLFIAPAEGAIMWIDLFVTPSDGQNPEGARAFIEHMLAPENIAAHSNETMTANAVPAAAPLVDAALASDPKIYPDPETMARLVVLRGRDAAAKREIARAWTRLRLGVAE